EAQRTPRRRSGRLLLWGNARVNGIRKTEITEKKIEILDWPTNDKLGSAWVVIIRPQDTWKFVNAVSSYPESI
ncbi:MAG: hypothetical protein ACOYNR_11435, partial [Blastocatellia bacterium]